MTGTADEVRGIVRDVNEAWLQRRVDDLARWLHEEIVIAPPGFGGHVRGRREAVASYAEFAEAATVHSAEFDAADVQAWGDVAVATCKFALDYEMGGERHHDTGWDVLVLRRPAGTWQIVWRTVIPADGTAP